MAALINNEIYHQLGERWYEAYDDPVALLRAQSRLFVPWIQETLVQHFKTQTVEIAELGCGGGFLSNGLAQYGHRITGIDLSQESLQIAKKYDKTQSVSYRLGDVLDCPMEDQSFDAVISFDVLEHVSDPRKLVAEAYRILKPGGIFIFHTFNRNLLSYLVVIKLVEWLVQNTPKHLHVLSLFVKPEELKKWSLELGFEAPKFLGVRPSFRTLLDPCLLRRVVPRGLKFIFTQSLTMTYCGTTVKPVVTL